MRTITAAFSVLFGLLVVVGPAAAQQPIVNPTSGCTATPAQIEEVRKAGIAFTRSQGAARVAPADPSYKQHNPAFYQGRDTTRDLNCRQFALRLQERIEVGQYRMSLARRRCRWR